jgi:hypothetical protein
VSVMAAKGEYPLKPSYHDPAGFHIKKKKPSRLRKLKSIFLGFPVTLPMSR